MRMKKQISFAHGAGSWSLGRGMLNCTAACLSALIGVALLPGTASAKPTGWRSPSELKGPKIDAWAGYSDSGYVARPAKAKSAGKTSSRKTKKTGRTSSKSRKAGFKKAVADSGLAPKKEQPTSVVKYAALEPAPKDVAAPAVSATGGGVRWAASSSCLNGTLISVVGQVAATFGPVTVNSTCRSRKHNAAVGGARRSQHLTGDAVDFRVHGANARAVYAYLKSSGSVGGLKHYGGGLFHIDTGPRRTW